MLLVLTFGSFALMRLAPGDPTLFMFMATDTEGMTAQQVRDQMGIQEAYKGRSDEESISNTEFQKQNSGSTTPSRCNTAGGWARCSRVTSAAA